MLISEFEVDRQFNEIKKKTIALIILSFISALIYWWLIKTNLVGDEIKNGVGIPLIFSPFITVGLFFLADSKVQLASVIAYPLAIFLGVFLGGISGFFERAGDGIVIHAVLVTFTSAISIVYLYKNKLIKVNSHFLLFTSCVISTIALSLGIDFVMSFIDLNWRSLYHGSSTTGIVLNAVVLLLGYLIYILDLNAIDESINKELATHDQKCLHSMHLLVDLAWIYFSVIFLMMRIRGKK